MCDTDFIFSTAHVPFLPPMFRQGGIKVVERTGRKTIFCSHWNFAKAIIRLEEFLVSALVDIYLAKHILCTNDINKV